MANLPEPERRWLRPKADAAKKSKAALEVSGKFRRPVATEIAPAGPFYRAEEYHKRYLEKRSEASCHF